MRFSRCRPVRVGNCKAVKLRSIKYCHVVVMKTLGAVLAVVCLTSLLGCDGRIMRFVPDTDFENPLNWRAGRLPCRNERVHFPPTTASVFIQRNNTMLEIVLPNDGEIVLGEDVILTFPSEPDNDATCEEQDTFYNGSEPASWYDVRNWCEETDYACNGNPPPRLHTEKIPCSYDDVDFPFDSRFVVGIDSGADIRVSAVRILDQELTTSELRERIDSDAGRRQFVRSSTGGDTTITVSGDNRCDDVTGCACNNQQLKDKVCAIQSSRCNEPLCHDPVLPQQHCCSVCGAVLKLQYDSGFRLGAIESMLSDIYQSPTSNEVTDENDDIDRVWWIVSKVGSGSETVIQVVIANDGDGSTAQVVAYDAKRHIQNDMKESGSLRVRSVTMDVSGSALPSSHSHTGEMASSPGVIVVIVIVIVIIILAVAGAVVCYVRRRQGRRMPTLSLSELVRWRQRVGRRSTGVGDMELGRRGVVFDNRIIFDVSATGFDNLTFGSQPRPDLEQQPGMAAEAGFDNPMYGTGALQEGFGVPPARSTPSTAARSRLDPLPLVSKMAGMLRSLRFNVATQKLEEAPGEVAGTGSDVNDNEKPSDDDQPLPAELGYDVPATAADGKGAKKKRGSRKSKKGDGKEEDDAGVKHRKMEEEDSTDNEEDLTGRTARKLAKQMGEKGFGNPCYELGPVDGQPVTTATATPTSESAAAAAATVRYRTGFANPMFEETEKAEVTLKVADTGDSHAA